MTYRVTHTTGAMDADYPVDRFPVLLDELAKADGEHADVAVSHESEWTLTIGRSGVLILENVEDEDPMHVGPIGRSATLELMTALAHGRLDDVRSMPWVEGYPPRRK